MSGRPAGRHSPEPFVLFVIFIYKKPFFFDFKYPPFGSSSLYLHSGLSYTTFYRSVIGDSPLYLHSDFTCTPVGRDLIEIKANEKMGKENSPRSTQAFRGISEI